MLYTNMFGGHGKIYIGQMFGQTKQMYYIYIFEFEKKPKESSITV